MLDQVISWERPNSNFREVQCKRCQKWGHIARNCSRPFSCVKCDSVHEPGACLQGQNGDNPKCVNCGEIGHPASWRGCSAFKEYQEFRVKLSKEASERRRMASENVSRSIIQSGFVSGGKSYASCFHQAGNTNSSDVRKQARESPLVSEFLEIAKVICGSEPLEDRIRKFMLNYKTMSKEQAKQECLLLLKEVSESYGP